jgi:hypothetical protein
MKILVPESREKEEKRGKKGGFRGFWREKRQEGRARKVV